MRLRLRSPKTGLTVAVNNERIYPGDILNVRLSLSPSEKINVGDGRLKLVCTETSYLDQVRPLWKRDMLGDDRFEEKKHIKTLVEVSEAFEVRREVSKDLPHWIDFNLQLPADSPPSANGDVSTIAWKLTGTVDTRLRDSILEREVIVLVPKPGNADSITRKPISVLEDYKNCTLTLSMETDEMLVGQSLKGRIQARVRRDFSINSVVVELERNEVAGQTTNKTVEVRSRLQGNARLVAGMPYEWPFQIEIPESIDSTQLRGRYKSTDGSKTSKAVAKWKVCAFLHCGRLGLRNDGPQIHTSVYRLT